MATPTPAQKQANARVAIEQAVAYYNGGTSSRVPTGGTTAQVSNVLDVARKFADFMDSRA